MIEYRRQLSSPSYRWVGGLDISERLKVSCRNELKVMVGKYKDMLSESDYDWFNLEGDKVYNMPSLNLLPKVHKLSDEASSGNERLLRGRPIITGHSWCLIEPSKFIQKELRSVILLFRQYLKDKFLRDSILCSSSDLVEILKKKYFVFWSGSTFVTFDFKDLYTNILFEDASRTLEHLVKLFKLDRKRTSFILELYKFCNRWNYFNVGGDIFKQEEGLSMGCYFSKEISDLVLMYSEYQYSLISIGKGVRLLKRYADDGILIFASQDYNSIVKEIRKLMLFYPSNLIINVKLNRAYCQYLDLSLSFDDVTAAKNRVHHRTFFKRFHKFAYLVSWSNHPKHVFAGLIRTECIRYIRNSSLVSDYLHSLKLFRMRLLKLGYNSGFVKRNVVDYYNYYQHRRKKLRQNLEDKVVYPVEFDKVSGMSSRISSLFRRARSGLVLGKTLFVSKRVSAKLRNILSTRRILHSKLQRFSFK